jgi:hypothetical protein
MTTMSDIKKRRVKAVNGSGSYWRTFDALWAAIPQALRSELSSRQLNMLVNVLNAQWQGGSAHRAKQHNQEIRDYGRIL